MSLLKTSLIAIQQAVAGDLCARPGARIRICRRAARIRLARRALLAALAAFNIGVEIGQVVIVALIFPLLLWSDRIGAAAGGKRERHATLVYACSAVILAFGLYWLIERTVFA